MTPTDFETNLGISRRSLLQRGAVVGGLIWAVPTIQSITMPAYAGSPPAPCPVRFELAAFGQTGCVLYSADDPNCCVQLQALIDAGDYRNFLIFLILSPCALGRDTNGDGDIDSGLTPC